MRVPLPAARMTTERDIVYPLFMFLMVITNIVTLF
jgi:hypothetical protein